MRLYRRILSYYRPHLGGIAASLALTLGGVALGILKPWPVKWVIDGLLTPLLNMGNTGGALESFFRGLTPLQALLVAGGALVAISLTAGAIGFFNHLLSVKIGLKALLRLRTELYSYLQHLPLHFHDRRRSGDSTFRVAYDAQAVQTFFNRGFGSVIQAAATLVLTFAVMWAMHWQLALVALAICPLLWLAISFFAGRVRRETATAQAEESDVLARASEGLASIRVVHAFGREATEVQAFETEARQSLEANLKLSRTHALSTAVVGAITALGAAAMLVLGARAVLAGQLKIGDLYVFLAYLAALYQPLEQLSYTAWAMEGAAAGMQRVFEVLDTQDSVPETPGARTIGRARGAVELDGVDFAYEPGQPILQDINLKLEPGQTVALVGGTGAGKTTLLSLVPRFYDPTAGRVMLDGVDVREISKQSLRAQIGIVLQETLLLNATIRENIAYGREGATASEIEAAARAAQAHEFITALPSGYETQAGERGVRLSGGQRQRIGLARAFLKAAPILLLDEPTSALDLTTEAELMETLRALMQRQTTLIVTHRLATIHHADVIHVMERGRIVESGTGSELLTRGGAYAKLWEAGKNKTSSGS